MKLKNFNIPFSVDSPQQTKRRIVHRFSSLKAILLLSCKPETKNTRSTFAYIYLIFIEVDTIVCCCQKPLFFSDFTFILCVGTKHHTYERLLWERNTQSKLRDTIEKREKIVNQQNDKTKNKKNCINSHKIQI